MFHPQSEAVAAPAATKARRASALRSVASHLRFWPIAAAGLALDLWSKKWAFETLSPHTPREIIKDWLQFRLSLNAGALFGMGSGFAPIFVGASVLAMMFVIYLFVHSTPRHRSMHVALGLVLAGALGNLYDRTMVRAYVFHSPATRQYHIGQFLGQEGNRLLLGDYPTGHNAHYFSLNPGVIHGMRPVVRDFIKIEARVGGREVWPWIFNVADALLVVGVAVLLLNFWFERRDEHAPA